MTWHLLSLASILFTGCASSNKSLKPEVYNNYITTASGLRYKILQDGSGDAAKVGQQVLIFETTAYLNGTILYSNEPSKNPVKVLIGGNQATNAVDEGLRGMKVGEIRHLIAAPYLVKRKFYPANVSPDSALSIRIILHKILLN